MSLIQKNKLNYEKYKIKYRSIKYESEMVYEGKMAKKKKA